MRSFIVSVVVLFYLAGCDRVAAPSVSCSSDSATGLVRQVVLNGLRERMLESRHESIAGALSAVAGATVVHVNSIRTTAKDEKLSKHECTAALMLTMPPAVNAHYTDNARVSQALKAEGVRVTSEGLEVQIEYVVQPTDDHKEIHAQVRGHTSLVAASAEVAALAISSQIAHAPPTPASGPVHTSGATPGQSARSVSLVGNVAFGQGNFEFYSPTEGVGYGFDAESEVGKKILDACPGDSRCALNADVDARTNTIIGVQTARKIGD